MAPKGPYWYMLKYCHLTLEMSHPTSHRHFEKGHLNVSHYKLSQKMPDKYGMPIMKLFREGGQDNGSIGKSEEKRVKVY